METQICKGYCKLEKPLTEFSYRKQNKNGRKPICRECINNKECLRNNYNIFQEIKLMNSEEKTNKLIYLYDNRSKLNIKVLGLLFECTEEIIINALEQLNIYNKKKCRVCCIWKEFADFYNRSDSNSLYYTCKDCRSDYIKLPHVKEYRNKYTREAYHNDSKYNIRQKISKRLRETLIEGKNNKSCLDFIGCDLDTIQSHLFKFLPDDEFIANYAIDHIRPVSSFDFTNDLEIKNCWNYKNLQLLPLKINQMKQDKWDGTPENVSFNLKYVTLVELQENIINF